MATSEGVSGYQYEPCSDPPNFGHKDEKRLLTRNCFWTFLEFAYLLWSPSKARANETSCVSLFSHIT